MTQRVFGHLRKAHDPEPAEGERVRLLLESLGAWQLPGLRAMLCRCGVSTKYIHIYIYIRFKNDYLRRGETKASIPPTPIFPKRFFTHRLFTQILFSHRLFTRSLSPILLQFYSIVPINLSLHSINLSSVLPWCYWISPSLPLYYLSVSNAYPNAPPTISTVAPYKRFCPFLPWFYFRASTP